MAVCQELGIENEFIPRIATAFAGGMARSGEVCGAVVGATHVHRHQARPRRARGSRSDDGQQRSTQRFVQAFREEMGTLLCRELTGFDLSTPEGLQAFRKSDVPIDGLPARRRLRLRRRR